MGRQLDGGADADRSLRQRMTSWWWDYLAILIWLVLVFSFLDIPQLIGWIDLGDAWTDPATADGVVSVLTVMPYLIYRGAGAAGRARATWGKRRAGLAVWVAGETAVLARIALRNVVKVLPWQLGHMAAIRFATTDAPTAQAQLMLIAALVLLAAIVGPIPAGRRGLHDWVAGTDVRSVVPRSAP